MSIKQVVRNYRSAVGDRQFYQELILLPFVTVAGIVFVLLAAIIF